MTDEAVELQRWSCYVDEMDDEHVHLVMHDETGPSDGDEYGSFPRRLLEHLDPKAGQYVTVRVMSDERILVENTERTDGEIAAAAVETKRLLSLLHMMRREEDDPLAQE